MSSRTASNPDFDADKTYSMSDVTKALSELAGRKDQYEVREVEAVDGLKQTQVIDKDTGSIAVASNRTGSDAANDIMRDLGAPFVAPAVAPKEAVEENKVEWTERGVRITPSMPEALEAEKEPAEVNPKEDMKKDDREAPTNQRATNDLAESKSRPETKQRNA